MKGLMRIQAMNKIWPFLVVCIQNKNQVMCDPSLKEFLHVKSGGMTYDLTLNFFVEIIFKILHT